MRDKVERKKGFFPKCKHKTCIHQGHLGFRGNWVVHVQKKITHHCNINSRKAACWSRSTQEKDIHTLSNSLVVVLGALQSTLCLTHKSSKICLASGIKKKQLSFLTIKKKIQCSPQLITNPEKLDLSTVKHFAIKLQISTWSSKF